MAQDKKVLVVGAGPTGLTTALRLAQWGVQVQIVDAARTPARESRAALIHAATLEIFDRLGVIDAFLEEGIEIVAVDISSAERTLAHISFTSLATPYPFALGMPQNRTEAILIAALADYGVSVERGVSVRAVRRKDGGLTDVQQAEGVHRAESRSEDGEYLLSGVGPDGEAWSASASYVIGAGGKNSAVRQAADISFELTPYTENFLLADLALSELPAPAEDARIVLSPHGILIIGRISAGHVRIIATLPDNTTYPDPLEATFLNTLLAQRGLAGTIVPEPSWSSRFHIAYGVASQLRRGNIFLAGDAAHVHSPAAGQGMNTGIADAYALAEGISEAVEGQDQTLDAYQTSRLNAAHAVVRFTDLLTHVALWGPPRSVLRNLAVRSLTTLPPVRKRIARLVSGLDRSPLP